MRLLVAGMMIAVMLAGCADEGEGETPATDLDVYVFWYPDEGLMTSEDSPFSLSWAVRVANNGTEATAYAIEAAGLRTGRMGMVSDTGWDAQDVTDGDALRNDTLAPGAARLWLFEGDWFAGHGFTMRVTSHGEVVAEQELDATDGDGVAVSPGQHVQTMTVGLWANGTSFYTNLPAMLQDPAFPAGGQIDRDDALAAAGPLSVYVYDQDRSEQPDRSIDRCYGTTIPGYNALLKEQAVGITGVRFLMPEEGYTREGAEDHFLYGDPLVFMNTVVAIDRTTDETDDLPDPQGDCFDVDRYTPEPVPDVPPLADTGV